MRSTGPEWPEQVDDCTHAQDHACQYGGADEECAKRDQHRADWIVERHFYEPTGHLDDAVQ